MLWFSMLGQHLAHFDVVASLVCAAASKPGLSATVRPRPNLIHCVRGTPVCPRAVLTSITMRRERERDRSSTWLSARARRALIISPRARTQTSSSSTSRSCDWKNRKIATLLAFQYCNCLCILTYFSNSNNHLFSISASRIYGFNNTSVKGKQRKKVLNIDS